MKNQAKVQVITVSELTQLLMKVEKGTFINILTVTTVKMNKKNNPYFEQVLKLNKFNALIGNEYDQRLGTVSEQNGVEKPELGRNFVGEHVSKCVLFNENKNEYYLQYEQPKNYVSRAVYVFNNRQIEKSLFESFLVKKKPNPNKPTFLTVMVKNIKSISIAGVQYIIH